MEPAQLNAIASDTDRELRTTEAAADDAPLPIADKLVVICFLIGVALFSLITVVDLAASLFR
jgi:hypothetical protein